VNAAKRYAIVARAVGVAVLLACTTVAARAQDEGEANPRWSLKAGAFFPTQGTLRGQSGSPYYVLGVEFDPDFRYRFEGGRIAFGAEAMFRESRKTRFLTIPLTARITWDITPPTSSSRVYGGLGAGIYFIGTQFEGQTLQPGARFILGADLGERWFIETNYDYVSGFTDSAGNGIKPSGLSLLLGYRY
jgi:hypothetical protein